MPYRSLACLTSSSAPPTVRLLTAELISAGSFHLERAITGASLHHDGSYFHYLEGDQADVAAAGGRLALSAHHKGLLELSSESLPKRHFSAWVMGFGDLMGSPVLEAEQAKWLEQLVALRFTPPVDPGVKMLMDFWNRQLDLSYRESRSEPRTGGAGCPPT